MLARRGPATLQSFRDLSYACIAKRGAWPVAEPHKYELLHAYFGTNTSGIVDRYHRHILGSRAGIMTRFGKLSCNGTRNVSCDRICPWASIRESSVCIDFSWLQ